MSDPLRHLARDLSAMFQWLVFLNLGLTVFTDLIIALALCYYLRRMRSTIRRCVPYSVIAVSSIVDLLISRTSSMINGLMVYAVNTGLLTSLVCVGCLIAVSVGFSVNLTRR